jgi:WD40 repeat protein
LHQFGFPELLTPYRKAPAPRVHSLKFASAGSRFGAVDDTGTLSLWQFESADSQRPFGVIPCHAKRANDLCFLESANVVATAGLSKKTHAQLFNVAVWDTLIAPSKACVAAFHAHPKGATTLAYSEAHRVLFSGGKTGELCAWDMRMQRLLSTVSAHTLNIRALAIEESLRLLASGSSDGSIRVWSVPDLAEVAVFPDAHRQQTFTKNQSKFLTSPISTFGVMAVAFWGDKLISSGADGRLTSRMMLNEP